MDIDQTIALASLLGYGPAMRANHKELGASMSERQGRMRDWLESLDPDRYQRVCALLRRKRAASLERRDFEAVRAQFVADKIRLELAQRGLDLGPVVVWVTDKAYRLSVRGLKDVRVSRDRPITYLISRIARMRNENSKAFRPFDR